MRRFFPYCLPPLFPLALLLSLASGTPHLHHKRGETDDGLSRHERESDVSPTLDCAAFDERSPAKRCCAPRIFDLDEDFDVADVDASKLTADNFLRDFVAASRPVIIRNGMGKWRTPSRWTNDFIAGVDGDRQVSVELARDNVFRFYGSTFKSTQMSLRSFLGRAFNRTGGPDDENQYYLAQQPIQEMGLHDHIKRPSFTKLLKVDAELLWIGVGSGQTTPIHYDDAENVLAVIDGEKHFTIAPATSIEYLSPVLLGPKSAVGFEFDPDKPDFRRFPHAKRVPFKTVTLRAGDMFYLPSFWPHQVKSYGRNVMVNFWFSRHSRLVPRALESLQGCLETRLRKRIVLGEIDLERKSNFTKYAIKRIKQYHRSMGKTWYTRIEKFVLDLPGWAD